MTSRSRRQNQWMNMVVATLRAGVFPSSLSLSHLLLPLLPPLSWAQAALLRFDFEKGFCATLASDSFGVCCGASRVYLRFVRFFLCLIDAHFSNLLHSHSVSPIFFQRSIAQCVSRAPALSLFLHRSSSSGSSSAAASKHCYNVEILWP
jgi:hypothetical protein